MTQQLAHRAVLAILLICQFSICLATDTPDPNKSSKYLDAVREFADNVLKYGRDTYGPKHTPLFVDGLNIHTREPVKWKNNGEVWYLSNLASQQNLFRVLDGLTKVTGDPKYRQAAVEAIEYAFENLRSPNGLLYWGGHIAYDALGDKLCARGPGYNHELKCHYPYYELMWEVNPEATKQFIESFWSAHILDWSNLDMNRHGRTEMSLPEAWDQEYEGGPVFFKSQLSWSCSFITTSSDLCYAASLLSVLSGDKKPVVWGKRLIKRYVDTRDPAVGISGYVFTQRGTDPATSQFADDFPKQHVLEGTLFPCFPLYSLALAGQTRAWISCLLAGELLADDGTELRQWALEELTAWARSAYREKENVFVPMLTDGTSLEGYVYTKDGYYGPKGSVVRTMSTPHITFWAYALACRVTNDKLMWKMARNIAKGNGFGEIGEAPGDTPNASMDTKCSDPYILLGFLELYQKTGVKVFLELASMVGDNILKDRLYMDCFVPSKNALHTKFDYVEPLALLHLYAVPNRKPSLVPQVYPSWSFLGFPYDGAGGEDTTLVYCQTKETEHPLQLRTAAYAGNIDEVKALISKGIDINAACRWDPVIHQRVHAMSEPEPAENVETFLTDRTTALHWAAEQGHMDVVGLLIANGANINVVNGDGDTPLHYAVRSGTAGRDIVGLLISRGADARIHNRIGLNPLDVALSQKRTDVVGLLKDNGATVSTIHVAVSAGDIETLKTFLEKGADVNAIGNDGNTLLHLAAQKGLREVVELLIAKGADVNARNNDGQTPAHLAVQSRQADVIKLLLEKETDANAKDNNGNTLLQLALQGRRWNIVKDLVDAGAEVNAADKEGQYPLHIAARRGRDDLIGQLLDKGADINAGNKAGDTALFMAAQGDHLKTIELLISRGADIHIKNKKGEALADQCLISGRKPIVEMLIDKGADTSTVGMSAYLGDLAKVKQYVETRPKQDALKEKGFDFLIAATTRGRIEVVTYLLDQGVTMAQKDSEARTALHIACRTGHKGLVELLVSRGSDVNADNWTPLKEAIWNGNKDIARFLMSKGANINKGPATALYNALSWGNMDAAKLLLELGADTNIKDPDGYAPLHYAWQTEIVDLLLSHGADINAKDNDGSTRLHYVYGSGYAVSKLLVDKGADIRTRDNQGKTALDIAIENENKEIAQLLESKGAKASDGKNMLHRAAANSTAKDFKALFTQTLDISQRDAKDRNGFTPLHCAILFWRTGNAKLLIDKGAGLNIQDNDGYTPLHLAAWQGMADIAELLINRGAKPNTQDNWGWTPLHRAVIAKQEDIAKLLIETGADATVKDKEGRTALWWAEDLDLTDTAELLKQINQKKGQAGDVSKGEQSSPVHDVAVTDISAPSTCKQGETVPVIITITNQGTRRETFRVVLIEVTSRKEIASREMALAEGWTGEGNNYQLFKIEKQEGAIFCNVRIDGDVNNDGFSDIMINDVTWKNYTGRHMLFLGTGKMQVDWSSPDVCFEGENEGDRFGDQSGMFADINNDGCDDVVIGAFKHNNMDGRVYVFYGGQDMDSVADIVLDGEKGTVSAFGLPVAMQDIDHDGFVDILVGGQLYDKGRGRAYLFWGGNPIDTIADCIFEGEGFPGGIQTVPYDSGQIYIQGWFGRKIDVGGDVNGDGYVDVLVGARHAGGKENNGAAYFFFGNTKDKMDTKCDYVFRGNHAGDEMGASLDLYDIDNDGFCEVIIGARYANQRRGEVYIWWGSRNFDGNRPPDLVLHGEIGSCMSGGDIECGDFNKDGYGDILVGAAPYPRYPVNHGRAYLFYGNDKNSMDSDSDHIFDPEESTIYFGADISVGDINNDGYADALIGAEGNPSMRNAKAFLYFGPFNSTTSVTFNWDTTNIPPGKHILKANIAPVAGEEDISDNTMTAEVEVKGDR